MNPWCKSHVTPARRINRKSQPRKRGRVTGKADLLIGWRSSEGELRSSISLDYFMCSLFQFSHFTGDWNIPRKQPSMIVVSSIYQLRTAPKPVISLPLKRPRWLSKGSKSPLVLHDITQRPRILFDWLIGYRYPQICRTNIDIASTMSVYPAQFPGRGFQAQIIEPIVKQSKQTR